MKYIQSLIWRHSLKKTESQIFIFLQQLYRFVLDKGFAISVTSLVEDRLSDSITVTHQGTKSKERNQLPEQSTHSDAGVLVTQEGSCRMQKKVPLCMCFSFLCVVQLLFWSDEFHNVCRCVIGSGCRRRLFHILPVYCGLCMLDV